MRFLDLDLGSDTGAADIAESVEAKAEVDSEFPEADAADESNEQAAADREGKLASCAAQCQDEANADAVVQEAQSEELAEDMKRRDKLMDEVKALELLLQHAEDIQSAIPKKQARLDELRKKLGLAAEDVSEADAKIRIEHVEAQLSKIFSELQALKAKQMELTALKDKLQAELQELYLKANGVTEEEAAKMVSDHESAGGAPAAEAAPAAAASGAGSASGSGAAASGSGSAASAEGFFI
jgi:chromosome segregation ATPase